MLARETLAPTIRLVDHAPSRISSIHDRMRAANRTVRIHDEKIRFNFAEKRRKRNNVISHWRDELGIERAI